MYVTVDVHICNCQMKAVHIALAVKRFGELLVLNTSVTSYFQYLKLGYNMYE